MQEYLNKILVGNCLELMKQLPDSCIDCAITSPPYFSIRDYGVEGQIGLETTPDVYISKLVDVFHEIKRVLKPEGTFWLNIGDTWNGSKKGNTEVNKHKKVQEVMKLEKKLWSGAKRKDLLGVPWALATALRNPYYHGKIKTESDRRWIAAIIDGEGSICGTIHNRKDDCSVRTNIYVSVTNTSTEILNECNRIYPFGKNITHQKNGAGHLGKRDVFRWTIYGTKQKISLIQEIYPYLIAKKKQALLAYNFFLFQETSKKDGHTSKKNEVNEKRRVLIKLISQLNNGDDVSIPEWCKEPPSLYSSGFYLRNDIIWRKENAMPKTSHDRFSPSYEHVFLLTKSPEYYFNTEESYEPTVDGTGTRRMRDVWDVNVEKGYGTCVAPFPEKLIRPMVRIGCPEGGVVLDPFMGSGTTGLVAVKNNRNFIGFELNEQYAKEAIERIETWKNQNSTTIQ